MRKTIIFSILSMLCMSMLFACGNETAKPENVQAEQAQEQTVESNDNQTQDETEQQQEVVSEQQEEGATDNKDSENDEAVYPMTITDHAGREVTFEKQPESLVSCYYITTSMLLALDLGDEIVGVESNPEKRAIYSKCAPGLLDVTKVGSPKELDFEVCASINPDLVILPMRAKDMVEPLEKLGITVMVVNPESQDEVLEMIEMVGKVTGHQQQADKLIAFINDQAEMLKDKLGNCERPTVYLGGNSNFLSTASKGMYQNDLITLAGGTNVAGDIDDTYWVESSYEQILAWNPQIIVLASEAKYEKDEIQADASLADCKAVQEQKVYQIPSDIEAWDSPVPSGILGAVYMASVLHPDVITQEQYESTVKEYYETFYGFSYEEK